MADAPDSSRQRESTGRDDTPLSPLVLGVPIALGLVLLGVVLWLIFGKTGKVTEPDDGLRDLATKKEGRKLTKEEFTVIAADDAATSDADRQDDAAQKGQKLLDRAEPKDDAASKNSRPAAGDRD